MTANVPLHSASGAAAVSAAKATAPRRFDAYPSDWIVLAREIANELAADAAQRDRGGDAPVAAIRRLRESGLVNLLYPREYGGGGGSVREAAHAVLELARVDGSVAALLGFHYYNSLVPLLLDYKTDNAAAVRRAVEHRWLWGNVTQYVDVGFVAEPHADGGYTISGTKKWNTGAPLAEITTVLAVHPDRTHYFYSHIPTDREGLSFHGDWDPIGLRGADSSTVSFDKVRLYPEDILPWTHEGVQAGALPLWTTFGAVFYSAVFLGSTLGSLEAAREFATAGKRQFLTPGAATTSADTLVQTQFGELWIQAQAGLAYFDQVIARLQSGWDRRAQLTEDDRGLLAVETLALRSFTSQLALDITPRVFDFGGGLATQAARGFDRYWRDVRTLSSHDPLIYAQRTIGDYALNGQLPRFPSKLAAAAAAKAQAK